MSKGLKSVYKKITILPRVSKIDIETFLEQEQSKIYQSIKEALYIYTNIKFQISLQVKMLKYNSKENTYASIYPFFTSKIVPIFSSYNIKTKFKECAQHITKQYDSFISLGSGWSLDNIRKLDVMLYKYKPLQGGNSRKRSVFPPKLQHKHCVYYIPCSDNLCFLYALIAAVYKEKYGGRLTYSEYKHHLHEFNTQGISFPMSINNINAFEQLNAISINVYGYNDGPNIIYVTSESYSKQVDLLLYKDHYYPITNFSGFMCQHQRKNQRRSYYCRYCLSRFLKPDKLKDHHEFCLKKEQKVSLPEKGSTVKFRNFRRQIFAYFVLYLDLETMQVPTTSRRENTKKQQHIYTHQPISYGLKRVCCVNSEFNSDLKVYTGVDCMEKLISELLLQQQEINFLLYNINYKRSACPSVETFIKNTTHCQICKTKFSSDNPKYIDHIHIKPPICDNDVRKTNIRYISCNRCNLTYLSTNRKIYVCCHNGMGYDFKFIMKAFHRFTSKKIANLIPKSIEKYLTFGYENLVFVDTFQFLNSSLSFLVNILKCSEGVSAFKQTLNYYKCPTLFDKVTKKSVFPYEYLTDVSVLDLSSLPSRKHFFSSLKDTTISIDEYKHAQTMWRELKCENIRDYLEQYLALDVLLLADVFENFRLWGMNTYGLDSVQYLTFASYTMDCMYKWTGIELELITDIEQYTMLEQGLRGGITGVSCRYAKANNPDMNDYTPALPKSYLQFYDANSLYAYCLTKKLPFARFRFIPPTKETLKEILATPHNSKYGYILQVDLEYDKALHDTHQDYPLAPEKKSIKYNDLSDYAKYVYNKHRCDCTIGSEKLMCTLENKAKYVLHCDLLRLYVKLGMKVTRVHKILSFEQSQWMKSYVDYNVEQRKNATNEFHSQLFKLSVNSLFGKTLQNPRRYRNIRIEKCAKSVEKLISRSIFAGLTVFEKDFLAVECTQSQIVMDKPLYVGFTVLDYSKAIMYSFYHVFLKKYFTTDFKVRLLYTDTDSFLLHLENKNTEVDLFRKLKQLSQYFDFSNLPPSHELYSNINQKCPGFFKLEYGEKNIREFVGLRSKLYSVLFEDHQPVVKSKGIPNQGLQNIRHCDYLCCLASTSILHSEFVKFVSKQHKIKTTKTSKICLSAFEDKRYLLADGINSLPYGHYKIRLSKRKLLD